MPKDAELDRLKSAQDQAYQRKQAAWQSQDQAWKRRSAAREDMVRARDAKQRAYDVQQAAWEDLQRVRDRNGPRIDKLNRQQESSYQQMRSAFDRASSAHDARDGAAARRYADEGHGHKADSQSAVAERRRLIQEIRDEKARHEATRPAFQQAKTALDQARAVFDRAKAEHERKQSDFQAAKANFERAKHAFEERLKIVRASSQRRRDDKRRLAERAGVPSQYLDNVWVTTKPDGTVNIYFGGTGSPEGPGHGHYAMDAQGNVTYRRNPLEDHGSHNYTDRSRWDPSGSQPPHVGVVAGTDHVVSFKTGGSTGDHTLIADGDQSQDKDAFDAEHNHYGSKAEKDRSDSERWIDNGDRGHYTGPDH